MEPRRKMFAAGIPLFDVRKFVLPVRCTDRDIQHCQGGIKVEYHPPTTTTPKSFPHLPRRAAALDASTSAQQHEQP
ncbi:PREDICTED: uncharacterized protein LOC103615827 isoform X2 [Corvus brachyrhynchos]|uniref:uncharacterized protein LOC103615827 isoform X2 n=1 Tax=Corvus brachyrhynchos TaxID=85066 RepID=UPI000816461D|nr:PREDICTED: uncharacterized protein LOC103615827 isoform X2 [Corvus brachyrhynchos]